MHDLILRINYAGIGGGCSGIAIDVCVLSRGLEEVYCDSFHYVMKSYIEGDVNISTLYSNEGDFA